jgi:hypothetical protein
VSVRTSVIRPEWVAEVVSVWRARSTVNGWSYPHDWNIDEVEDVAREALEDGDLIGPLTRLGAARARSGADLGEVLGDVAALHEVLRNMAVLEGEHAPGGNLPNPDDERLPVSWLRAVAVGWSDQKNSEQVLARVDDGLTGLATAAYLRARLAEVYQECEADGAAVDQRYALAVISVDLAALPKLSGMTAMVLVADTIQLVFCAGETKALVTPSTAVVLSRRTPLLVNRTGAALRLAEERLTADGAASGLVHVWTERLPTTYEAACALVTSLRR